MDLKYLDSIESKEFNSKKYFLDIKKIFIVLKELKAILKPLIHASQFKSVMWKTNILDEDEEDENLDSALKQPKNGKMIIDIVVMDKEKDFVNLDTLMEESFIIEEMQEINDNQDQEVDEEDLENNIDNSISKNASKT